MSTAKHFRIEEDHAPTGMATAACRCCMACGAILTGAGGGGNHWICEPCYDALQRKPWRGNLRKLRDASTEDLLTVIDLL